MNNPKVLVTCPNSDITTRYISAWAGKTIQELKSKNFKVFELIKERANKMNVEGMIKKHCPSLIFLNGHGGSDCVTGQNEEILLKAYNNEHILSNSITYALSCRSSQILGPKAVEAGAVAYIGFKDDFVFFVSRDKATHPENDKTAELFLLPANHVVISLSKGHSVKESCDNAKKYFYKNIQKLLTSETSVDEQQYLRYLLWDMNNLVYHGHSLAKI